MDRLLQRQWLLLTLGAFILLLYFSYVNRGLHIDDALIYQRYIQNALDGHGLVYNRGERFNGLTSPLYTCLVMVVAFLIGDAQQAGMLLATLCMASTLFIVTALFARYEKSYLVGLGALWVSSSRFFYYTYGLETPLFLFLIGLCLYLFEKHMGFWLGIACALLLITRSEGLFLILAMLIEHVRQKRPIPPVTHWIVPAGILAAPYLFNVFYYGSWISETGMAKIYQGRSVFWGTWSLWRWMEFEVNAFFYSNWLYFYGFLGFTILGMVRVGRKSLNVMTIGFLVFYTAFFVVFNIPGYHWYYAPYYLFGFFYSSLAIAWLFQRVRMLQHRLLNRAGLIMLLFGVFIHSALTVMHIDPLLSQIHRPYQQIGVWLADNTPQDAKIALIEIGHVGLYSKRYIIDILGLVNPLNARFIGEKKLSEWLKHYQPDYILIHDPLYPLEEGVQTAVLLGDFRVPVTFHVPGFELLQQHHLSAAYLPDEIRSVSPQHVHLGKEDEQYALLVHAPGSVRFRLPPGTYSISGQFGIFSDAYSPDHAFPTDGVNFSVAITSQPDDYQLLFERFLNPASSLHDQGIQAMPAMSCVLEQDADLVFLTEPGPVNDASSDWSFWRDLRIQPEEESAP